MFKFRKKSVVEVFTPTSPATITFVERSSVATKIREAVVTPGKQLVLFGHSGCGKTTLLANQLGREEYTLVTTRCTSSTTYDQIMLSAFDDLGTFVKMKRKKSNSFSFSSSTSASYLAIRAALSTSGAENESSEEMRVVPPQLTAQNLAKFLGEAECCWVLEDFHKIHPRQKAQVSQIFKMFMDSAGDHKNLMIIAVGAVDSAREVIEYEPDMRNRVAEIFVPLMSDDELMEIILKGTEYLNISFSERLIELIIQYSNGLGSVCHQLCLNICFHHKITKRTFRNVSIETDSFEYAVIKFMESASDTLKLAFDTALKMDSTQHQNDAELILKELLEFEFNEGATYEELWEKVRSKKDKYPEKKFNSFLEDLQIEKRGIIVRYNNSTGKYYFENPFYLSYAMGLLSKERPKKFDAPDWPTDLEALFTVDTLESFDSQMDVMSDAWVRFIYFDEYLKVNTQKNIQASRKRMHQTRWTVKAPPPPRRVMMRGKR